MMKARSVSRELALLVLFQLEKKDSRLQWEKTSLPDLVVATVRTLSDLAQEQIKAVVHEIDEVHSRLVEAEIDHPINEELPLDIPTRPVPLPTTGEFRKRLEMLLLAVEQLEEALFLPEINALSNREDVLNYCQMLVRNVVTHQAEIDALINDCSEGWKVERLQKMELTLLRLAVAELRYAANVEAATVVHEILELAERFASEESRQYIHGVLGAVSQKLSEAPQNV